MKVVRECLATVATIGVLEIAHPGLGLGCPFPCSSFARCPRRCRRQARLTLVRIRSRLRAPLHIDQESVRGQALQVTVLEPRGYWMDLGLAPGLLMQLGLRPAAHNQRLLAVVGSWRMVISSQFAHERLAKCIAPQPTGGKLCYIHVLSIQEVPCDTLHVVRWCTLNQVVCRTWDVRH